MIAPGTDETAPTSSSDQSMPPGRWPRRPAAPTAMPTTRFVPITFPGLPHPPQEGRHLEHAQDQPDQAADHSDGSACDNRGADVRALGRFRERSVPTPQQVKAERDEGRAD